VAWVLEYRMTTDLFWTPAKGDKVQLKPAQLQRCKYLPGVSGPHTVISDISRIDCRGELVQMVWITPDGPVTRRTDAKGRVREERPNYQSPVNVQDIEPYDATQQPQAQQKTRKS